MSSKAWNEAARSALFPMHAATGEFHRNPDGGDAWALLSAAGAAASAYHGYRRNVAAAPVGWALWWAVWGALIPPVSLAIAIAQGYAKPAA